MKIAWIIAIIFVIAALFLALLIIVSAVLLDDNPIQLVSNLVASQGDHSYIKGNILQAFRFSSDSMSPTIKKGDRLFVNKVIYKRYDPRRGDIIAFKSPVKPGSIWVQRIIGLPNETLEIKDGHILINGLAVTDQNIAKNDYYNAGEYGKEGHAVTIPADSYYVLGDNSVASRDSRFFGLISRKDIVGKATFRYFPLTKFGKI